MSNERVFRLPKDIPLEEYPQPETYLKEARRLIDEAQKQGLILRVMGPIALHYYFPNLVDLYRGMERLGERVFTDIDYAGYGKQRGKMIPFFENEGYDIEKRALMLSGGTRHIYYNELIPMIDVFFDKLDFNHPINYKGRLEIHPHCVSLTDLLLQKLQIVRINDKDLKDAMLLLLAAPVTNSDQEGINGKYIAKIMSEDWGFYHTATTNLQKIKTAMLDVKVLNKDHHERIGDRADHLLRIIEDAPKSGKWRKRAKTGTSKPWFNEVSDW